MMYYLKYCTSKTGLHTLLLRKSRYLSKLIIRLDDKTSNYTEKLKHALQNFTQDIN